MTIDRLVGRFVRLDVCLVSDAMDVLGVEGFAPGLRMQMIRIRLLENRQRLRDLIIHKLGSKLKSFL